MPATRTAPVYCEEDDINLGDLQVPRVVSVLNWIKVTADEMDADIGQIYQLPLAFDTSKPEDRADKLYLKKINSFLATARIILIIASGSDENGTLHAYGKSLLGDAKGALAKIVNGTVVLESATLLPDVDTQYNGPLITNKDAGSFVDAFYKSHGTAHNAYTTWNGGINVP